MEPDLKRHLEVHLVNPQVNYIQHENCKYCKLDRRLQFSKPLQFPRNYRRPQIISNYNLESSYFYHLSSNYNNSANSIASNLNTFRPVNPVPPPDNSVINYNNRNRNMNRSLTRIISNPTNYNLPNIVRRNQVPIFEFYNLDEYEPPDLSVRDLNHNTSISIYLRGNKTPERCSICYEYIRSFEIVRKLNCGHQFHQKCVDRWFETKDNCPLCRYCLLDTEL